MSEVIFFVLPMRLFLLLLLLLLSSAISLEKVGRVAVPSLPSLTPNTKTFEEILGLKREDI